jgi:hypothetical protein
MQIPSYYKSKIFIKAISGIVIVSLILILSISTFLLPIIDNSIEKLEEKNAKIVLNQVVSMVNHRYDELLEYKKNALQRHKEALRDATDVTWSLIQNRYQIYLQNEGNPKKQKEIKQHIIEIVKALRYKKNGYSENKKLQRRYD